MAETAPDLPMVRGFKGLNTRAEPTALGWEWLLDSHNVLCDDQGTLRRRPGKRPLAGSYLDLFATRNGRLLAVQSSNELVEIHADGAVEVLLAGLTGAPFAWAQLGTALFVQSLASATAWAIYPYRVIAWGSLCPAASPVGWPVTEAISYPPPRGELLTAWRSRLVVGVWEPARNRSVLYFSRPEFPHEFRLEQDFVLLAGRIALLAECAAGLVVGTEQAIFLYAEGQPLQKVADYGARRGGLVRDDRDTPYFWTERGLCKCFPFENLTDAAVAVAGRTQVAAGVLQHQGSQYAIVVQTGDAVGNPLVRPYAPLTLLVSHMNGTDQNIWGLVMPYPILTSTWI